MLAAQETATDRELLAIERVVDPRIEPERAQRLRGINGDFFLRTGGNRAKQDVGINAGISAAYPVSPRSPTRA